MLDPSEGAQTWSPPVPVARYSPASSDISCPSPTLCVATVPLPGYTVTLDPSAAKPSWSAPAPVISGGPGVPTGVLTGVSCASDDRRKEL